MFCPSCGTEPAIELNYCNRCGANLSATLVTPVVAAPVSVTKPIIIIGTLMLFLTLGGFGGVLSSALELVKKGGGGDLSMAIVFFGMVTILTIDVLLFTLLFKLVRAALSPSPPSAPKHPVYNQPLLNRPTTARLAPAPSVTENTTRFFDAYAPVPVEPIKKSENR